MLGGEGPTGGVLPFMKGISDDTRSAPSPQRRSLHSPSAWAEFNEAGLAAVDDAPDYDGVKAAALAALRVDGVHRTNADVVAIGDWIFRKDHPLGHIFQTWRQHWFVNDRLKDKQGSHDPTKLLSPSQRKNAVVSAKICGNPVPVAFLSSVQLARHTVGALIYKEGDAGDSLYFIAEGKVGMWKKTELSHGGHDHAKVPHSTLSYSSGDAKAKALTATQFGTGSGRFTTDDLWRFGVRLAVLSAGEVFGEASVALGYRRLETAVTADSETGDARILSVPGTVYREHLTSLFAGFWEEIEKRETLLRSLSCNFEEWKREDLLPIAYWMVPQTLKEGRILYKEDDLIEHVYWLSEGALTVSCEINVIDTASAFNFGTFTANLPPATASGSGAQSRKRFAKLNKVKVLLKGMFALKRVRWSSEVTVIEGMEAGGGLVGKGSRSSLFPDADVRVVLDYVNGPAMVGEFEVIRQDATRRTTVYSASPNTTMYRLCKTLFKVLVLDKAQMMGYANTPTALRYRCELLSKWFDVRACRDGMQSVPVPWLIPIKEQFMTGARAEMMSTAPERRNSTSRRRSGIGSLIPSRRRSIELKDSLSATGGDPTAQLSIAISDSNTTTPSGSSSLNSSPLLYLGTPTPTPGSSPATNSAYRTLVQQTRRQLVYWKRITLTLKHALLSSALMQRIRNRIAARHAGHSVVPKRSGAKLIVSPRGIGARFALDEDEDGSMSSNGLVVTTEFGGIDPSRPISPSAEHMLETKRCKSPSGELPKREGGGKAEGVKLKRGPSKRIMHGGSSNRSLGSLKPSFGTSGTDVLSLSSLSTSTTSGGRTGFQSPARLGLQVVSGTPADGGEGSMSPQRRRAQSLESDYVLSFSAIRASRSPDARSEFEDSLPSSLTGSHDADAAAGRVNEGGNGDSGSGRSLNGGTGLRSPSQPLRSALKSSNGHDRSSGNLVGFSDSGSSRRPKTSFVTNPSPIQSPRSCAVSPVNVSTVNTSNVLDMLCTSPPRLSGDTPPVPLQHANTTYGRSRRTSHGHVHFTSSGTGSGDGDDVMARLSAHDSTLADAGRLGIAHTAIAIATEPSTSKLRQARRSTGSSSTPLRQDLPLIPVSPTSASKRHGGIPSRNTQVMLPAVGKGASQRNKLNARVPLGTPATIPSPSHHMDGFAITPDSLGVVARSVTPIVVGGPVLGVKLARAPSGHRMPSLEGGGRPRAATDGQPLDQLSQTFQRMDLHRILPRDLVNTHIVFKTPSGELQSGMLRSVQKGRVNQVIVYLVGIELDKPRDTGSTKDGYFLGYQVLDCAPGTGFVCEEKSLQGKIKRARGSRGEFWVCEQCKRTNQCLSVSSHAEYKALSHDQKKDLMQCGFCNCIRIWYCPQESCIGNGPLEVADITDEGIYETMTCPDCRRSPLHYWTCPVCDSTVSADFCDRCDPEQHGTAPSRDSIILLQQLKTYRWSTRPTPSPVTTPASGRRSASKEPTARERDNMPGATMVRPNTFEPQFVFGQEEKALADAGFETRSTSPPKRPDSPSRDYPTGGNGASRIVSPQGSVVRSQVTEPSYSRSSRERPLSPPRVTSPDTENPSVVRERKERAKALLDATMAQFRAAAKAVELTFGELKAAEDEELVEDAVNLKSEFAAIERTTAKMLRDTGMSEGPGRGARGVDLKSEFVTGPTKHRMTERHRMSSGYEENPVPPTPTGRTSTVSMQSGRKGSVPPPEDKQPQFTPRLAFHHLEDEYSGDEHVAAAIVLLKKKYTHWRAVLDDGNSFFRALFVGFLENCVQSNDAEAVLKLCDVLESVDDTEDVREWLADEFIRPMLRVAPGRVCESSLEAIDTFFADSGTFDKHVVRALRLLTSNYAADNAEVMEKDSMTLRQELLEASGVKYADYGEFIKRYIAAMGQPTTSVIERACVESLGWVTRIVDFSGTKILVRTINGNIDDEEDKGSPKKGVNAVQCTLLMSAGDTGAQFDVLVPKVTIPESPTYRSKSAGIHSGKIPLKYRVPQTNSTGTRRGRAFK